MTEIRSSSSLSSLASATATSNDDAVKQHARLKEAAKNSNGLAVNDSNKDVDDVAATTDVAVRNAETRTAAVTSLVSTAPTTPVSSTSAATTSQGATSFAGQVSSLSSVYSGSDSDSMTSAFMKLDAQNLDTNQDAEGMLNLAQHNLRVAAANIANALGNINPEALYDQASQLESQALSMVQGAASDGDSTAQAALDKMNGGGATDTWKALYDNASREITAAAEADAAANAARDKGDTAGELKARGESNDHEAKARTILDAAGIPIGDKDAEAMGKLALQMKAEGKTGNVMTEYLGLHPEKAQTLLTADKYAEVKDKGGQAIVDAIIAQKAASGSNLDDVTTLGLAVNAADQQTLNQLLGGAPSGALAGAAGLLAQAYELRIRAIQQQEALLDAQNCLAEGKTAKGQYGVADKNAVRQNEILKGLFAITGGTRSDIQARDAAAAEAARAQSDVAKLVMSYIDRHNAAQRTELRS